MRIVLHSEEFYLNHLVSCDNQDLPTGTTELTCVTSSPSVWRSSSSIGSPNCDASGKSRDAEAAADADAGSELKDDDDLNEEVLPR